MSGKKPSEEGAGEKKKPEIKTRPGENNPRARYNNIRQLSSLTVCKEIAACVYVYIYIYHYVICYASERSHGDGKIGDREGKKDHKFQQRLNIHIPRTRSV